MTNISIPDKQPATSDYNEQAALQQVIRTNSESLKAECELVEGGAVLVSLFDTKPFTTYTLNKHDQVLDIRLCNQAFTSGYKASVVVWAEEYVTVEVA